MAPKAKDAAAEKQAAEALPAGKLNPFHDVKFPPNFAEYASSFSIGDPKWSGMPKYTLSMTAEGETDASIAFLAAFTRTSDTVITITGLGGLAGGDDNRILVKAATQATQATQAGSVVAEASTE